jgi:hypothetical protein
MCFDFLYTFCVKRYLLTCSMAQSPWEATCSLWGNFPHCMEPEGSRPRLQAPATSTYLEPDQSSPCHLVSKTKLVNNLFLLYLFLSIFINLYMFRAITCPSSGETTVFMRQLVLVILCGWLSGMQGGMKGWDASSKSIKSSSCPHSTSWKSILILSSHLRLGLPST